MKVWWWGEVLFNYFEPPATTCKLLENYFKIAKTTYFLETQVLACGGGGGLGCQALGDPPPPQPTSVSVFERRGELQSRHSQLQSAYLSAVRNCDHVGTSSASAKCQIARGFHVYTTHKFQGILDFFESQDSQVSQVLQVFK